MERIQTRQKLSASVKMHKPNKGFSLYKFVMNEGGGQKAENLNNRR